MGLLDLTNHLLNFLAPALAVALVLAILARFFMPKRPLALGFITQAAINFIVGSAALALGLWFFGHDGKMASYAALLVAAASAQWVGGRGWR